MYQGVIDITMEPLIQKHGPKRGQSWSPPRGTVLRRAVASQPSQEYLLYVPASAVPGAPIFVTVHGLARNANEQARVFSSYCEQVGAVMIAPIFTRETHGDYQRLGRLGRGVRADHALDRCVEEAAALTGANGAQFYLFGFSGGAQFAHRYLMAHPHGVARAVCVSSGWYTFPDTRQRFPYGIRTHRRLPGVHFNPEQFLRVPVAVFVGGNDTTSASLRKTERVNDQQGVNRIERARRWVATMQAAAEAYGLEPVVSYREFAGVDHSFAQFCERANLCQLVFDALFAGQDVPHNGVLGAHSAVSSVRSVSLSDGAEAANV